MWSRGGAGGGDVCKKKKKDNTMNTMSVKKRKTIP